MRLPWWERSYRLYCGSVTEWSRTLRPCFIVYDLTAHKPAVCHNAAAETSSNSPDSKHLTLIPSSWMWLYSIWIISYCIFCQVSLEQKQSADESGLKMFYYLPVLLVERFFVQFKHDIITHTHHKYIYYRDFYCFYTELILYSLLTALSAFLQLIIIV